MLLCKQLILNQYFCNTVKHITTLVRVIGYHAIDEIKSRQHNYIRHTVLLPQPNARQIVTYLVPGYAVWRCGE